MKEQGPRGFNIETVISRLEVSADPMRRLIVESLKELRRPDAFNFSCNSIEPGLVQAARIIRKEGDSPLVSIVTDLSGEELERKKFRQLVNTIRKETKALPFRDVRLTIEGESRALKMLKEVQLKTVATMLVLKAGITGDQIVQIYYPIAFMNLDFDIPASQRKGFGFAIAEYFFRRVPIIK